MSPTYSKQYDREAIDGDLDSSNPLLRPATPRSSSETAPPVYPPSSSLALSPSNGERHIVEYTYSPVYPREGENQYAVGVLGRTKEETIEIVQRGIPGLAEFDASRISFKKKVEAEPLPHWAVILDEAWNHFGNNPPAIIQVVVADEPGDKKLRDRHHFEMCLVVTGFLSIIGLVIFGVIHLFS